MSGMKSATGLITPQLVQVYRFGNSLLQPSQMDPDGPRLLQSSLAQSTTVSPDSF